MREPHSDWTHVHFKVLLHTDTSDGGLNAAIDTHEDWLVEMASHVDLMRDEQFSVRFIWDEIEHGESAKLKSVLNTIVIKS